MKKKKSSKKNEQLYIPLHIYGLYNKKTKQMLKVSLDMDEIAMELALEGGNPFIVECDFDVTLLM